MSWWGKLLGGTFGFMIGGPIGALIGAALGHGLDRGAEQAGHGGGGFFSHQERAQTVFFTATFSVMGHIAKADGRVTPDEIRMASLVMDRLGLSPAHKHVARQLFSQGKEPGFPLDEVVDQLRRECHFSANLLRVFLEIQVSAAYADGRVDPAERRILRHLCDALGFSAEELESIERLVRSGGGARPEEIDLDHAYAVMGVSADTSDTDLKRAYRRLMSRHHPDKLIARGLPEEMIKVATEKTKEIKAAYERIKRERSG